ncbi:hypothetical protein [Methylocaldum sp.]|uniref:hypothetical protein n=1 Tax=Methylocaldum sp. TaxID=1969727 RepID=UPI002D54CEDF|nr:hypothetical protein [Methylocaldum sp.]HYE35781.1 hypothetical protein [Methylocaldum sp.]
MQDIPTRIVAALAVAVETPQFAVWLDHVWRFQSGSMTPAKRSTGGGVRLLVS